MIQFTIPGTLPGLNEYVRACRTNARKGSAMSRAAHILCRAGMIRHQGKSMDKAYIRFRWVEKDKRRDKDNIAFAKKFILDSLQEAGILRNDGWAEILGFADEFAVDKQQPRVEVVLYSAEEYKQLRE